jgi:PTS system beta-glucosides-specific IIC component
MFGLTLKLKKPLIATFIACAVGGLYCGLAQVKVFELVTVSLVSLPQFIDPAGSNNFVLAIIGMGLTFAVAFIATWLIGFDEDDFEDEKEPSAMGSTGGESVDFIQPVTGKVKPLSECSDPAFAKGTLGKGILIIPSEGTVVAPFDGTVTAVAETGHALGLTSDSGSEVIIHIGIDTVELKGAPFSVKVTQGQRVRAGQLLETFDINAIESAGKSAETVVLMSSPQPLAAVK